MTHLALAALFVTATATVAPAQPSASADRWAPWMGCWQLAEESIQDTERLMSTLGGGTDAPTPTAGARVCVTPSAGGGATMTTLVNDKPVLVETIVADGQARPLTDPACRGTQRAEWSPLAPRVYAKTEVTCGDRPTRVVSGLSTVIAGPLWVDVQHVESEGRKSMRVRRYRPAPGAAQTQGVRQLGTMPLGGKPSIAEIAEISNKVPLEVTQALVVELGTGGYALNAKRLIELDDAGVPDRVIDLMVAMSFPKKFVVERAVPSSGPGGYGDSDLWGPFAMWPYYAHPLYYSSYYSPFGYSYWGYYDPFFYGTPGVVVINPSPGSGSITPSGSGRVVNGEGYTRIRPNNPEPSNAGGGGWGTSSAGGSGSSGGGTVTTGGYSGGGASGGGERVAVPRPPGGH